MNRVVVVMQLPGSPVGDRIGARARERGVTVEQVSLDAPLQGLPVTVRPDAVHWEGVDLLDADALFVERPIYAWPQAQRAAGHASSPDLAALVAAEREARALGLSALLTAASGRAVANRPEAARIAASPAIALDALGRAGLPVQPWRLAPAPRDDRDEALLLDAAGRDRWHVPRQPSPGEPAIRLQPCQGEVLSVFVVGDTAAGALVFDDDHAWASMETEKVPGQGRFATGIELAIRAARTLDLSFAAVAIALRETTVLWLEAGPDVVEWDTTLDGRISAALAEHLVRSATRELVTATDR